MVDIVKDADSVTLVLNDHAFTSFGVGDNIVITPLNSQTSHTNSSDGGVSINTRSDANVHELKIMIQKYSGDDVFLNEAINSVGTTVFAGSLVEDFTRDGVDGQERWTLEGGSIMAKPSNTKNDQDGNATQEYMITFRNAVRSI